MSALRLVPAAAVEATALVRAFNDGYSGYEVPTHLDESAFAFMVKFVDIALERSIIAYDGEQIAAMALLALRGPRAWIAGMGVPPAFRGRGHGAEVMRAAIANARTAGAHVLHLEVLVSNAPAIRIYESLGFMPTRRLVVWQLAPGATPPPAAIAADVIAPLDPRAALDLIDHWVTDPAPWQRAPESIAHLAEPPLALGLMHDGAVAGAVVYRATPERVSLLALAARAPRQSESLAALVAAVRTLHPGVPVRCLNLPEGDPAEPVFEYLGARAEARQIEMKLAL